MSHSDFSDPKGQRSERVAAWNEGTLECIGSFTAHASDGAKHTVEIWTHFGAVHDRDLARVEPGLLILTTTHGFGVDRIEQGQYRLTDHPEITLSTDDPNAP